MARHRWWNHRNDRSRYPHAHRVQTSIVGGENISVGYTTTGDIRIGLAEDPEIRINASHVDYHGVDIDQIINRMQDRILDLENRMIQTEGRLHRGAL